MVIEMVEQPKHSSPASGSAVQPVPSAPTPQMRRATPSLGDQQLDAARALRSQGRYAEASAAAQRALEVFTQSSDTRARYSAGTARALKELCDREQQRSPSSSGG
jgi:Arc/MetJ-type ribon-helix-helix transcriptional regulator